MKLFKKIISDVSYVSKLTGTHNKKLIIAKAVIFSQICAFLEIMTAMVPKIVSKVTNTQPFGAALLRKES